MLENSQNRLAENQLPILDRFHPPNLLENSRPDIWHEHSYYIQSISQAQQKSLQQLRLSRLDHNSFQQTVRNSAPT